MLILLTVSPLQEQTPLLTALRASRDRPHAPFYAPGHKHGRGIPERLSDLLGAEVFRADLPELPELDNLFAPYAAIQEAQELAAEAFGADETRFLANGSTCGIEAAVLATCSPGDKILLPRNAHQSAIAALILSGAVPVFITPEADPTLGIAHSITPESVAAALKEHPDAKAVMMVYPTYYGVCGEVAAIAQAVHQHDIPLLVDEAHGAHFAFHPDLPTPALAAGADLTVQSIHKTLGAMTQAAMLHVRGDRIDRERLSRALTLVQSTSPSYLLLASLDAARHQMAMQGKELLSRTLELGAIARTCLQAIPGIRIFSPGPVSGCAALDPTRLTVDVSGLGLTGFEADERLHTDLGVMAELPGLKTLTFILTSGNIEADIKQMVRGFHTLSEEQPLNPSTFPVVAFPALCSTVAQDPRKAFFAQTETVPTEAAGDRLSADLICPYPPGIPILIPGERITSDALEYLQQVLKLGGVITGCADPTLRTVRVLAETATSHPLDRR